MSGLPIADAPFLRPAARRVRLLRWALTGGLAALIGVAVVVAPRGQGQPAVATELRGETTEVVLDVSGSVSAKSYRIASRTLAELSRGTAPIGLILFSDSAEEALPPGSPPAELRPFARIFTPRRKGVVGAQSLKPIRYVPTPWYPSFSGGTRMSVGLAVAAQALRRDHVRGRILVLSDLGDAPDDRNQLRRELLALGKSDIDFNVLALPNALPTDRAWFTKLEGRQAIISKLPGRPRAPRPSPGNAGLPIPLVAIAALLAVALAANELLGRSLRWGEAR
jgi:hypothetical protein